MGLCAECEKARRWDLWGPHYLGSWAFLSWPPGRRIGGEGASCLTRLKRKRSDTKMASASLLHSFLRSKDSSLDPSLTPASKALPSLLLYAASGEMDIQALRFLAARLLGSLFQNSLWSTDCSLSSSSLVPGGIPVSLLKSSPFLLMGKEYASGR